MISCNLQHRSRKRWGIKYLTRELARWRTRTAADEQRMCRVLQGRYDLIRIHRATDAQFDHSSHVGIGAVRPLLGSQTLRSRALTPNNARSAGPHRTAHIRFSEISYLIIADFHPTAMHDNT
jgi:hypothetical protein